MGEHILLLALSEIGFAVSWFVWSKKSKHEKLVCVIGKDCDKVIRSKYGDTFGFDNTLLGMLYFAFVFVASVIQFFYLDFYDLLLFSWGRLIISGLAALFSAYLILIQIFVLKEYCEYCLATGALSIAIFLVVLL